MKTPRETQLILDRLESQHPDADTELHYRTPFQLLVATILSAQSTDARVNMVTPALFARYRDARALAKATPAELEPQIHSTGFFRAKSKSLIGMAQALVETHGGEVPASMDALVELPGVGRKTANVVLGNAFHKDEGIVVDTHVMRLSHRFKITRQTDPEKIEQDLTKLVPKEHWTNWSHWLIWHGRRRCFARKPDCHRCEIFSLCPSGKAFIRSGEALAPPD
jgi:endonuclease III